MTVSSQSYFSDNPWLLFGYTAFPKIILFSLAVLALVAARATLWWQVGACPSCGVGLPIAMRSFSVFLQHRLPDS